MTGSAWVRLYGGPEIVVDDDSSYFTPIQACLLALAYLEPRATLTRERITWMLWGTGEDAKSRHRIRQLLYSINGSCPSEVLERQGEAIVPLLPSDAGDLDPNDEPPLARITSHPTTDFEQWFERAVERLEARRRSHLARLVDELSERGEWSEAGHVAFTLAQVDPSRSEWVDLMVRLSVKARAPNTCLARLTELVAAGHLEQRDIPAFGRRLSEIPLRWLPSATGAANASTIGRAEELNWLQTVLGLGGGLRFVAVEGVGGIGKTRLIEEAGLAAVSRGANLSASCLRQTAAAMPMAAVRTIVASLLGGPRPPTLPQPWAGILGLGTGAVESLEPLANNRRFVEAVRIALSAASADRQRIVAVDDFQFADSASLEVLAEVHSSWRNDDCVVLVSARCDPEGYDSRLAGFLADVRAERIRLGPVSSTASLELIESHAPEGLPESIRADITKVAGGNPQMLIDLTRSWKSGEGWTRNAPPKSLREVIARRLGRLTARELEVLALVAAAPGIGSDDLGEMLSRPSWRVVEALDRLVGLELIEMNSGGYRFRHSLVQAAAKLELGSVRDREAHLRIARRLARDDLGVPSEIVHHFREGGASAEAFSWAVSAARQARELGAISEALAFFEVALEASSGRDNPELLAEAGLLSLLLCRRTEGIALLKSAEDYHAPEVVPEWAIARLDAESEAGHVSHGDASKGLGQLASICALKGDWEASLAALETAIRVLEREGDCRAIQEQLGVARSSIGQGSLVAEIRRHMILALGMVYGDPSSASRAARRAFRMAFDPGCPDELRARAAHRLFVVLLSEGRVETSLGRRCLEVLKTRARATGDLKLHYTTLANQAVWHLDTDGLDEAEALLDEAEFVVSGSRATNERQNLATNRGDLLLRQNRPEEALRSFEVARAMIEPGTRGFLADVAAAGIGLAKLRLGQFQAAERLSAEFNDYEHYYFDASLMIRLRVELARHRGRKTEALGLLSTERARLRRAFVPQYLSLTFWEGQLRRRSGVGDSSTLFREVLARAQALGIKRLALRARALVDA